ncbi:MAG: TatD family hydrolase, partial [Clostridia bacterium]|nr:TatD family hydrolase [Clostridia bacterium]
VLRYLPRDRVLLETDSPYLSPEPRRGERNDSSNLVFVAEKLATLWNCTPQEAADITAQNARRIFNKLNA